MGDGLGRLQGDPTGGAGEQQVTDLEVLQLGELGQGRGGLEDHVVGERVLPRLAVDRQGEPQLPPAGHLVGVGNAQVRADRAERAVALALVPLALGQLDVARADVVGQDERPDVVGGARR